MPHPPMWKTFLASFVITFMLLVFANSALRAGQPLDAKSGIVVDAVPRPYDG